MYAREKVAVQASFPNALSNYFLNIFFLFQYRVDCVLHAAAHKAVAESCRRPLQYYDNNVVGSFNLIRAMDELGIKKFVFSSSSTVYGTPLYLPMDEEHRAGNCTNPYGKTKFMVEEIVKDMCLQDKVKLIQLRTHHIFIGFV